MREKKIIKVYKRKWVIGKKEKKSEGVWVIKITRETITMDVICERKMRERYGRDKKIRGKITIERVERERRVRGRERKK